MKKNQLIAEFSAYLEAAPSTLPEADVDLFSLFTELSALKNEVKREARQVKDALDQFRAVFTLLEEQNKQLQNTLTRERAEKQQAIEERQRAILSDLLQIRDQLDASAHSAAGYQPRKLEAWCAKHTVAFMQQSAHGQTMILRAIDHCLAQYQVRAIDTLGEPLDPQRMHAVETAWDARAEVGVVLSEQRKGFMYQDSVLRVADVVVNKKDKIEHE